MTESAVTVETERFHGRNRISSKAIRAVVSAITAAELGIEARTVGVELSDDNGGLTVAVSAPVAIAGLSPTSGAPSTSRDPRQPNLIDQAIAAQNVVRRRMLDLTGSAVGVVNIRLTAAHIKREVRVR